MDSHCCIKKQNPMVDLDDRMVYVIDDDAATREALDSLLRSVGYRVELFGSGTEFLDQASPALYGCIVLDVRLPGPSGLEVQRRLADRGILTPIVFMTGHGDIAMAVQAMKANAVEFLTKPVRDQDLLDAIDAAFERSRELWQASAARTDALQRIGMLSPREREVFALLCQGRQAKQIAPELGMSESTVKVHRRNLMHKLGVHSLGEMLLLYAAQNPG